MKKTLINLAVLVGIISCGSEKKEGSVNVHDSIQQTVEVNNGVSGVFFVDTLSSLLKWKGTKLTGEHHGLVSLSGGAVNVENGKIQKGELIVDLVSITEEDVEANKAAKLENHLKSAHFFEVEKFPVAKVSVVRVKDEVVTADLTLRGRTKTIEFPSDISISENELKVVAEFSINRTDWGIVYKSGNYFTDLAKDKVISDQIDFEIEIQAKK